MDTITLSSAVVGLFIRMYVFDSLVLWGVENKDRESDGCVAADEEGDDLSYGGE